MDLLRSSVVTGLALSITSVSGLFSPVNAGSCELSTGLYEHQDGTQLYLYKVKRGGYQLNVEQHNYTANGQCKGNRFIGLGSHEDLEDIVILQRRDSRYRYYSKKDGWERGAWYEKK